MRFLVAVLIVLMSSPVIAATYCQWDGTKGVNCRNDNRGYLPTDDGNISPETELFTEYGYYPLNTTYPVLGTDQTTDQEQWSFDGTTISRTWTVRAMTATEIDIRDAQPMPINTYYLWKTLLATGTITQAQANARLPQELIDAYQARDRLENP